MEELHRRLAVVLNADVVGFTRLMADDDVATVRAVAALREHVEAVVREHRGRLLDFVGDNLLAEFPSALGGVRCAIALQRLLEERNEGLPAARRLLFRIGAHAGDVIDEGTRIFGDPVNTAERLQALALTGGICISGALYEQVHRQLEVGFEDLGVRWLKNLPDPVRVFRVRPGTATEATAREESAPADRPTRRLSALLACDGAGYIDLSAQDELGAFETLASFEEWVPDLVRKLRGRIVDQVGDGLFAEFPSASEAVRCAVEIQQRVEQDNLDLPEPRRLAFRIAVHLDEVILRGERLYGQGVHAVHQIARRVPGGEIHVTQPVHERVDGKVGVAFEDLGAQSLGALPKPLRTYRVILSPSGARGR